MLRRLPADDGSSSRNPIAWRAGSYRCCAALAVAGLAHGRARPCALRGRSPMLDPLSAAALALSLIQLRRLRQPVRRLQLERERGKVEPAALKEQSGLPAALFRAEEQERALGIIGRGGGNQARNGHGQIRRCTTATLSPRRSLSSADGRALL